MDGFSDRLDDLYRSFSSLGSREQRERAVEELSVALQRMSATLDSPTEVLAEEATRIITAEYGGWSDLPSTSYERADESSFDPPQELFDYEAALREEEGGGMMEYWRGEGVTMDPITGEWIEQEEEEERRKRGMEGEEGERKRRKIDPSVIDLRNEELEERVIESIQCAICGEGTGKRGEYMSHMEQHNFEMEREEEEENEEKKKEWRCNECGLIAGSRKTLWRHGRSSGHDWSRKENDYSCENCEYTAGSKFNLERHRLRNHPDMKDMICPLCFAVLPSSNAFLAHHLASHREKIPLFECELCGKSFSRKDKLLRHQKCIHESIRPFSCPSCSSSFPSNWHLRRHQNRERGCSL